MALPGSQRRDQRRRLLMVWKRDSAPRVGGGAAGRTMAEYAPAALPERHPGLATLLPTGLGRLGACAAGIVVALSAVLAAGLHQPSLAALERAAGTRFTQSVAIVRDCIDPRAAASLAGWMAHMLLIAAAAVALVVRFMRRHRRDDYAGRYRAWGWLAGLLVAASCTAQVPLGRALGALLAEATGVPFGPAGYGWWVTIAATMLGGVSLWAVIPLHERMATAAWLTAGLAAWGVSAAATWPGASLVAHAGVAPAAWAAGCGLVAIAMLVAARSVIREVRGEAGNAGSRAKPKGRAPTPRSAPAVLEEASADGPRAPAAWPTDESSVTDYTDGSEDEEERDTRHLSKAERKRLRKLARLNRAA